jgi:hypothetical protein
MIANTHPLGEAMEEVSRIRPVRRWRVLLAHDATAPTCDALVFAVEDALGNVDLTDASSVEDARVSLRSAAFHVCLVCLDLPPAPLGGARLAQQMLSQEQPVVLVTRSLRWIPQNAPELRDLPWISPDACAQDVAQAIRDAISTATMGQVPTSRRSLILSDPALGPATPGWLSADGVAPRRAHARPLAGMPVFGRRSSGGDL